MQNHRQKKKLDFQDKVLLCRFLLTALLATAFLLVFFLNGGMTLLLGKIGKVKNFASQEFEVHFLDVGQGDCAFVRFPDERTMLIDAGPVSSGGYVVEYLSDLFKQEGLNKIDYFLFSHHDADHIGGAADVLDAFEVGRVYRPKVYCTYEIENFGNELGYKVSEGVYYNNVIRAVYQENCQMVYSSSDIEWTGENYSVKFLTPQEDTYSVSNDYSAMVKIDCFGTSFLFTGDAEDVGESEAISNFPDLLQADVLKVAHHGGAGGSSSEFLSYVQPSVAVISVGKNNGYGHPTEETLDRLAATGCQILRTDQLGSIAISADASGQILIGGTNNAPKIDLVIVIVVFFFAIAIVWGVKPTEKTKIRQNSGSRKS